MVRDTENGGLRLLELNDRDLKMLNDPNFFPDHIIVSVYDLDRIMQGSKKEDALLVRGNLEVSTLELSTGVDLKFEYDHFHKILVLAHGNNYYVCLGETLTEKETRGQMITDFGSEVESLRFTLQKSSILDNTVKSIQLKNMRLYLVDSEYSLIVYTITITE